MSKRVNGKERWLPIFQEVEDTYDTPTHWCREHGVSIKTYFLMRKKCREAGIYPSAEPIYHTAQEPYCFTYVDQEKQRIFFLYTKPAERSSKAALLSYLTYRMEKEFFADGYFLFLSADRKDCILLRKTPVGISITKSHKERGTIPWFDEQNRIQESTLNLLKAMV